MVKIAAEYILITCCTYKREKQLERLLNNLTEINYPQNIKTEILIVDNDIEESAKTVIEKFEDKLPVHYCIEKSKGFVNVRNKALREAINLNATHIAFIDDDEIADVNWLLNHIDFYNKFENIYISSGPTLKKFEGNYPDYIVNNKIFQVKTNKKNGTLKKTCASGNVFFPLNIIKENNIYFSEEFNKSGGEDTNFFGRLNAQGFNIGQNNDAVNFEIVDSERTNIKWILKRAFNTGKIKGVIKNQNIGNIKKYAYITEKSIIGLLYAIFSIIVLVTGRTNSLNCLTKTSHELGKVAGAKSVEQKKTTTYSR